MEQQVVATATPVELSLAGNKTVVIESHASLSPDTYVSYAFPPGNTTTIQEVRSFVENIHRNFVFINLINFENHQLSQLDIQAKIPGVTGTYTAQITDGKTLAEIDAILPLTAYLESHILQFQITKRFSTGTSSITPWMNLNFSNQR